MQVVIRDHDTLEPSAIELHVGYAEESEQLQPVGAFPLGVERAPGVPGVRGPNQIIGGAAITGTGNTALSIGELIGHPDGDWTQVAYVVLTPEDRRRLLVELARHEAAHIDQREEQARAELRERADHA